MNGSTKDRRHRYYHGILAAPMPLQRDVVPAGLTLDPPAGLPQFLAEIWSEAIIKGREEDSRRRIAGLQAYFDRIAALWDHFEIDPKRTGSSRDLALSLAYRHEPKVLRCRPIRYSELFERYSINAKEPEADFVLALKMAHKHVPGFAIELVKLPKARLSTIEIIYLLLAVALVDASLKSLGKSASDRQIAATIMCPKELSAILPKTTFDCVTAVISRRGNKQRITPRPLSDRALRSYIAQFRSARRCFNENRATAFQLAVILKVKPIISRVSDE